ncbi:SDR family NAD(P)-dependent oxidoreductase [Acuticoccus mangrovi]|uniref:SDR family oxidoreductase n=1 Tax=Acuticoccus mangrovi TaxID=2796142 RepID=A0A934MMF4_9HYPH|nr:SDR family oxidoreductase [Acuticoccus mangrovi]MBJ3777224.1 SDR family oxidoreductase [Acuticoccus mangrovi]
MGALSGKVAIVTGASRGIGAAAAEALAAEGATVALVARTQADEVAARIGAGGGRAIALAADVADYDALAAAVATARERLGGVDILVNNAGVIEPIARLGESDPDAWDRLLDVNVKGVYHGLRAVLPEMAVRGTGVVINISSGAATAVLEGWSAYCASKAAVLSLTRAVHDEYGGRGVRVVGLSPGTVATDMQRTIRESGVNAVSRLDWESHISPQWAGRAVAWLATDAAADLKGVDVSLREETIRRRIGLI